LLLFFAAAIERCDEMNNSEVAEEEDREMQRRKTFSKNISDAYSTQQFPNIIETKRYNTALYKCAYRNQL